MKFIYINSGRIVLILTPITFIVLLFKINKVAMGVFFYTTFFLCCVFIYKKNKELLRSLAGHKKN